MLTTNVPPPPRTPSPKGEHLAPKVAPGAPGAPGAPKKEKKRPGRVPKAKPKRVQTCVLPHGVCETRYFLMTLENGETQGISVTTNPNNAPTVIRGPETMPLTSDFTMANEGPDANGEFTFREPTTQALLYRGETVLYFSSSSSGRIFTNEDEAVIIGRVTSACPRFPRYRLVKFSRYSAKLDPQNMLRHEIVFPDMPEGKPIYVQGAEMLAPDDEKLYETVTRKPGTAVVLQSPFYTSRLQDLIGVSVSGGEKESNSEYNWQITKMGGEIITPQVGLERAFTISAGFRYSLYYREKRILSLEASALNMIQLGKGVRCQE